MRLLLEEHKYTCKIASDVLDGLDNLRDLSGSVSVNYVGYYFNEKIQDCVFILPKVLMGQDDKVFGLYAPEDIIDLDTSEVFKHDRSKYINFLYNFSIWIYRAIKVYQEKHPDSSIIKHSSIASLGKSRKVRKYVTFLEVLLELVRFNKEEQNFLLFTIKNIHKGYNRINWAKTVSKGQSIISNNTPIYLKPINKKRVVDFDEELFIIYFSILKYINKTYGFPVNINVNFELLNEKTFKKYLKGYGAKRLKEIRYKYFSDKAVELWELCYAFFARPEQATITTSRKEYLLAKDFNIVFEAIIDELVGNQDIPAGLQSQRDNKQIDHLWLDKDLVHANEEKQIYYIGDSKYYKNGNSLTEESIYKQFTYARNVIQWSFDALTNPKYAEQDNNYKIRLVDPKTEGYNIIPNFFISATVDFNTLDYNVDGLKTHSGKHLYKSKQFENRLFDRDTLILTHYDVNFLYVLSLYARNESNSKKQWKGKVRDEFRKKVQEILDQEFNFYAMKPKDELSEQYIKDNFQDVLGKIYSYQDSNVFTLALDTTYKDNQQIIDKLKSVFIVSDELKLGDKLNPTLEQFSKEAETIKPVVVEKKNVLIADVKKAFLDAFRKENAKEFSFLPSMYDVRNIDYLLPVVGNQIKGYYKVNSLSIKDNQFCLTLDNYTSLGEDWVRVEGIDKNVLETLSFVYKLYK